MLDANLVDNIRDLLTGTVGLAERRMFGGLAFLIGGNMAIAVNSESGLLLRVDREESDEIVARTSAEVAVMSGRRMSGWLQISAADLPHAEIVDWVDLAAGYARSLPVKS